MARTDVRSIEDLVGLLTSQHDQVRAMMPQVLEVDGHERARLFTQVRRTLAVHEAFEQEAIHQLAKRDVHPGTADARVGEEDVAASTFAKLEGLDLDSEEFARMYRELCEDVAEHAENEELEELAHLRGVLPELTRAKAARQQELLETGPPGQTFEQMLSGARQELRQVN